MKSEKKVPETEPYISLRDRQFGVIATEAIGSITHKWFNKEHNIDYAWNNGFIYLVNLTFRQEGDAVYYKFVPKDELDSDMIKNPNLTIYLEPEFEELLAKEDEINRQYPLTYEQAFKPIQGGKEPKDWVLTANDDKSEKPPLGIIPTKFWKEARCNDIIQAIVRYYEANKRIPTEWIEEYNQLIS